MKKLKIGISIGDINGVGPEVVIKTFSDPRVLKYCTPVIYASSKIIAYHKNIVNPDFQFYSAQDVSETKHDRINVINILSENVDINLGTITEQGGKVAIKSLQAAVKDLKDKKLDALVTAPIHKKSMQMAGFEHVGHTQYLAEQLSGKDLMMMVNDDLRVGLVTDHIPLKEVAKKISKDKIVEKIRIMEQTLKVDFGIERPTIAVLGLNPHASDDGLIGTKDIEIIRPAIVQLKKSHGLLVTGPHPADGFFGSGDYRKYDGIIAMYHDQGLIPFKLLSFGEGVNFTAGLSAIRTSPDHGTAFDIAGKNEANPGSFRKALFAAMDISRQRAAFHDDSKNSLVQKNEQYQEYDETKDEVLEIEEEAEE